MAVMMKSVKSIPVKNNQFNTTQGVKPVNPFAQKQDSKLLMAQIKKSLPVEPKRKSSESRYKRV